MIRELYASQCKVMLDAMAEHFPRSARWSAPRGGMFIWVTLPAEIDCQILLEQAISQQVAFVPGAPFYSQAAEQNTLRLSFVTVPADKIQLGIKRLGSLINEMLRTQSKRVTSTR
jgi:2-aminoadipate transaminase